MFTCKTLWNIPLFQHITHPGGTGVLAGSNAQLILAATMQVMTRTLLALFK